MLALSVLLSSCGFAQAPKPAAKAAARPHKTAVAKASPVYFKTPVHYRNRVVVLMFHAFVAGRQGDFLAPNKLRAVLEALRKAHMNVLPLASVQAFEAGRAPVPPNAVLITIDDGDQSVFTGAFPSFKALRMPFTCFIIAGWVGQKGRMTWSELRTMQKSGLVSYGSHTYAMHEGAAISPSRTSAQLVAHVYSFRTGKVETDAQYRSAVLHDVTLARSTLRAHLGGTVTAFAYPFGAYDPEVIALLEKAGYQDAFTTQGGAVSPHLPAFELPRINVGQSWQTPASVVDTVEGIGRASETAPFVPKTQVVPSWK